MHRVDRRLLPSVPLLQQSMNMLYDGWDMQTDKGKKLHVLDNNICDNSVCFG